MAALRPVCDCGWHGSRAVTRVICRLLSKPASGLCLVDSGWGQERAPKLLFGDGGLPAPFHGSTPAILPPDVCV